MLLKFNKFLVFFIFLFVLVFFYNISYAGRTVNINVKIPANSFIAANGDDSNNYSAPCEKDSNDNILNLNVAPGIKCAICGGAGKGEVVDPNKPESLLEDVRNNTLNINCNIDNECYLFSGMTSTGTVSSNIVNVYGGGSSTNTEAMVGGGGVFVSGCAEKNTVNIYKDFSCKGVVGGIIVRTGTSSFNTVNVFSNSNLNILELISGGGVHDKGISINNSVNVYGSITAQGTGRDKQSTISGGNVNGGGSATSNRVNIAGTVQSTGNIYIIGAKAEHTTGNIVSISGKIAHTEISTKTVTIIAGSDGSKSAVNNKVIIYETAEIPNKCILYGNVKDIQGN
ncbi:MAG: hypothetical protein LBD61_01415, partial [Endomicrobium sp.]|nr:hypothetical protein [Endomicrobium sp.]